MRAVLTPAVTQSGQIYLISEYLKHLPLSDVLKHVVQNMVLELFLISLKQKLDKNIQLIIK